VAHHEDDRTTLDGVLNMLIESGLEGMADAMARMLHEAMKIERSSDLRAEPGGGLGSASATLTASRRSGSRPGPEQIPGHLKREKQAIKH